MKKIHLVIAIVVFSAAFLLIQFIIHHWTTYPSDNVSSADHSPSLVAVKLFAELCIQEGIPIFIVEPRILVRVHQNHSMQNPCTQQQDCLPWCQFVCTDHTVTSVGVVGHFWKHMSSVLDNFRSHEFAVMTFNQTVRSNSFHPDSRIAANSEMSIDQSIITHCLFRHVDGHVIHLVIFYKRGDDGYLWHGSMPELRGFGISLAQDINFGLFEGAYNSIELSKVILDGIRIRVPKLIPQFLTELRDGQYIECDHSRAAAFREAFSAQTADASAEQFSEATRDILLTARTVLDGLGIRFWLSSGTCLGWFRQCGVIPYSQDVDIGIWITDYKTYLITSMQSSGLELTHRFGKVEDSFELSFLWQGIKLDIFFFYEEADYMWNGGTQARTGKKFKYLFPKFSLCWTEYIGLKVRVPCDTLSYIEANYGSNWFEPVKSWDWKRSPSNVQENGVWPDHERPLVIQQFHVK